MLQIAKKWNCKWISIHQEYFSRKIPAINASFASKYMYLQDWSLKFGQNIKVKYLMCQVRNAKIFWKVMQKQTQVTITSRFLFQKRWMYVTAILKLQRKRSQIMSFLKSGKLSTMYYRMWLKGCIIIHTCYILLIWKAPDRTSQFKVKIIIIIIIIIINTLFEIGKKNYIALQKNYSLIYTN